MPAQHEMLEAINEAGVLRTFADLCEKYSCVDDLRRLRNIFSRSNDPLKTTSVIAVRDLNAHLASSEIARLYELIMAYLQKSSYRQAIPDFERERLLRAQSYKCALCKCAIDSHAHADHIVPFKYVGDELLDNLQMLCSSCNTKKNADLFYQIKFLMGLV